MLVVDTSVLLAAADNADPDHHACAETIQNTGPLVTTALVIAETAYLIGRQLGAAAEARFFRAVADGELQIETITPADARRIAELIETYADLGLGGTDASLIVPWGARTRSSCCGEFVFVDEAAEQIAPVHMEWGPRRLVGTGERIIESGGSEIERAVRSLAVVVRGRRRGGRARAGGG